MGTETRVQTLGNGTPEEWRKRAELVAWGVTVTPRSEPPSPA